METYNLAQDINLLYVKADSFPDGIKPAFEKLESIIKDTKGRQFFGISYPVGKGQLEYLAAVKENFDGEAESLHCDSFTVPKGKYVSTDIHDYMKDIPAIGITFQQLLSHPDIDPKGFCVEMYLNEKDVKCMVKLN